MKKNQKDNKQCIIYKQKIKVALTRGEPAFREAAKLLRNMLPLPLLEFKKEICIPLPNNENDLKDANYLTNKVKEIISKNTHINAYFKDLIKIPKIAVLLMIVDDSGYNSGKRRNTILNENFKYIGITSGFIGKTFISYLSFSKWISTKKIIRMLYNNLFYYHLIKT